MALPRADRCPMDLGAAPWTTSRCWTCSITNQPGSMQTTALSRCFQASWVDSTSLLLTGRTRAGLVLCVCCCSCKLRFRGFTEAVVLLKLQGSWNLSLTSVGKIFKIILSNLTRPSPPRCWAGLLLCWSSVGGRKKRNEPNEKTKQK